MKILMKQPHAVLYADNMLCVLEEDSERSFVGFLREEDAGKRVIKMLKKHLWMNPLLQVTLSCMASPEDQDLFYIGFVMGDGIPPFKNPTGIGEEEETSRARQVKS